jgi:hypothetical protein
VGFAHVWQGLHGLSNTVTAEANCWAWVTVAANPAHSTAILVLSDCGMALSFGAGGNGSAFHGDHAPKQDERGQKYHANYVLDRLGLHHVFVQRLLHRFFLASGVVNALPRIPDGRRAPASG